MGVGRAPVTGIEQDWAPASRRPWRTLAVAVPGAAKRRSGLPGEDAARIARLPEGVALAVADGAGSAARAADAANLVAGIAVAVAQELVSPAVSRWRASAWERGVEEYAATVTTRFTRAVRALEPDPTRAGRSFRTTLTATIATRHVVACVRVGDGFVVARRADRDLELVMPPDAGGTHAGETHFLDTAGATTKLEALVVDDPDVTGLVLSSDGLRTFTLGTRNGRPVDPHPVFVPWVLDRVGELDGADRLLGAFLTAPRIIASTADDLAVAAAVR